mmetsp:Transcript_22564/g.24908  ORF Transcript_22564/g.24908 Transcript_22564/m.24908 type:complete len:253 (+) Transcript_22564:134-892(+)
MVAMGHQNSLRNLRHIIIYFLASFIFNFGEAFTFPLLFIDSNPLRLLAKEKGLSRFNTWRGDHLSLQTDDNHEDSFSVRKCKYDDLKAVTDIVFDSFYSDEMRKSPFSILMKLKELDRLQSNFPYDDEEHSMFVAIDNKQVGAQQILGFVDIDTRPPTRPVDPPRPYMSDLAVHPDHRRKGIARSLIETCEKLAQEQYSSIVMYIRVENKNQVAVKMYERYNYIPRSHPIFGVKDSTVLLRKDFKQVDDKRE